MKGLGILGFAGMFIFFSFYSTLSAQPIQKKPEPPVSASKKSAKSKKNKKINPSSHERARQYQMILLNKNILRPQKEVYKYNEPADLIELVPVLRDINRMIPRQFSLAEHEFLLNPSNITIRHELMDVRKRAAQKTSIISLTYSSPMGYFGSRLDVPLFYSSKFGFSDWSRYPLGNYTMTLNRDNPFGGERTFYIKAQTRF